VQTVALPIQRERADQAEVQPVESGQLRKNLVAMVVIIIQDLAPAAVAAVDQQDRLVMEQMEEMLVVE
jgi:hypothetical protein